MLRGVLGGFLTGTILSGLALGAASLLTAPPLGAPPEAAAVDVPAGSEFKQSRQDTEAALPGVDEVPAADSAPMVAPPAPDDLSSLEEADTAPASQPETGAAESTLTPPDAQSGSAGVDLDSDEPVLPSPQALAPEAPDDEDDLAISTEPAQPGLPEVEEESGVYQPAQPQAPGEDGEAAAMPQPGASTAAADAPKPAPEPATEPAPSADATEPAPMPAPDPESEAEAESEGEAEPSGTIGDLAENVTTDRLPSVTDEAANSEADLPPLQKFAVPFSNPEGKPLMAIVLIDDGQSPISHEALADFPYPVSYAVDAGWPGAAEAAEEYRAAGLEVLAMADLPPGASASDAEVAMQVYLSNVPGAVAVMEGTGSGLQSSRAATEQLIPILKESGHGLVLFSEGLDTARKLIAREGVPVASVFRDFDAKGQNATVIRRFLDQAAFKAGQEQGGVIMVGRLRAETVSALLLWGLQDRAGSVALAPVSAVLQEADN